MWSRRATGTSRHDREDGHEAEPPGLADRPLQGRGGLAQAAARHPSFARRVDVGLVRRRLRRESPIASGSRCAASCRCRKAPRRGRRTRRSNPSRGNSTGNGDGISATCEPEAKRGWERRFQHSILIVDGQGNLVDEWPHLDELFSKLPCGRGPHQIKISPYDKEKHVWIIDDQLHMIYRFTYDGKLVHSKGQLGVRGRGPNTFDRPTDIAWLPDGTYFITDGYGGTRVAKYDAKDNFIMDWGQAPEGSEEPRTQRVQHRAQHRDQRRPAAVRGRPRSRAHAGVRRRTASSSTCGRCDRRTGRPARTR